MYQHTGGCNGDSGSGLVGYNTHLDLAELVGIASWVKKPCGSYHSPTVFTRDAPYTEWIWRTCGEECKAYNENKCHQKFDRDTLITTEPLVTTKSPGCPWPTGPETYYCPDGCHLVLPG